MTFTVNGVDFSGLHHPNHEVAKGNIVWSSDFSDTKRGWRLCPLAEEQHKQLTCSDTFDDHVRPAGEEVTLRCPSGCGHGQIWGSNPYTTDSVLCAAARHAGKNGGNIKVKFVGDKDNHLGSTKHGVTTDDYADKWNSAKIN